MTAVLELLAIRKEFTDVVAVRDFDLVVHPGELVTLLGPSGCGKTTVLRIVAGFETATAGTVLLSTNDITSLPAHKRNMGMVFQGYSLFPHLTVDENIGFGLRMRGVKSGERRQRVNELLEIVRLAGLGHRYPHQLSGGQQQRVAIARALAPSPEILLLDEPLSALDAKVRDEVRDEIRRLNRELGVTTLFVTHDQEEALGISDRVCIMNSGKIEQIGGPRDVYEKPANRFVADFIGSMNHVLVAGRDISVRPEHVSLTELGSETALHGTIREATFAGAFTRFDIALDDGTTIIAMQLNNADRTFTAGDTVGVRLL
jgi:putative spermidine/putrescine transport system ATP-binding protein